MARQSIDRNSIVEKIRQHLKDDISIGGSLHLIPSHLAPVANPPSILENGANWTLSIDPSWPLAAAVRRAVDSVQRDFDLLSPFLGSSAQNC